MVEESAWNELLKNEWFKNAIREILIFI